MLGHCSTAITEQVCTAVFEDVERDAAESAAALVPVPTVRLRRRCAHRVPTRAAWEHAMPPAKTKWQLRTGGVGGARVRRWDEEMSERRLNDLLDQRARYQVSDRATALAGGDSRAPAVSVVEDVTAGLRPNGQVLPSTQRLLDCGLQPSWECIGRGAPRG